MLWEKPRWGARSRVLVGLDGEEGHIRVSLKARVFKAALLGKVETC